MNQIADAITEQFAIAPEAPAVESHGVVHSYANLVDSSRALADVLSGLLPQGTRAVPVLSKRGHELIVTALALMRLGVAYVPIDVATPVREIVRRMTEVSASVCVACYDAATRLRSVSNTNVVCYSDLVGSPPSTSKSQAGTAGGDAYVVFTTGSTGVPKGVAVSQRALVGVLREFVTAARIPGRSRWLWAHSPGFGFSLLEMWAPLIHGGTVVVAASNRPRDIHDTARHKRIDILCQTPSGFSMLDVVDEDLGVGLPNVKTVILSGERPSTAVLVRWRSRHKEMPRIISTYALTETAGQVAVYEVSEPVENPMPLGKTLPSAAVFLVDKATGTRRNHLRRGRIAVSSPYLFDGYYSGGRPPERQSRRRPRTLVTNDMGFVDSGGRIHFDGRIGRAEKVLGYQVSLSAIEDCVLRHSQVRNALAFVDDSGSFVILVVESADTSLTPRMVREFLIDRLPSHSVPSLICVHRSFQTNLNGKLDRDAIKQSMVARTPSENSKDPFREIMSAMREILDDRVDGDVGFVEHGLNSLDCAFVASRLITAGYKVSLVDLFRFHSPRVLAESLHAATSDAGS